MPEWDADLRARLAGLQLTPAREAEIIEELSQHLDDRYEELQASGASNADARRMTLEELSETGELAQRMRTLAQAHAPAPIVHGQASRHPMHGLWEDLRYLVGVIANIRQRRLPSGEFDPVVYSSYVSTPPRTMEIVARSALGPSAAAAFVAAQVRAIDADLPLMPATTVDDALTRQIWPQRLFGSMFAAFASIAMLLATCGLYGVTSYAVSKSARDWRSRRTRSRYACRVVGNCGHDASTTCDRTCAWNRWRGSNRDHPAGDVGRDRRSECPRIRRRGDRLDRRRSRRERSVGAARAAP